MTRSSMEPPICGALPLDMPGDLIPVERRRPIAELGSAVLAKMNRPTRASHTVRFDSTWVRLPNVMLGTDACTRCVVTNGAASVGGVGLTHSSWWKLCIICSDGVSRQLSLPKTLFCSYVRGNAGSAPGWLS